MAQTPTLLVVEPDKVPEGGLEPFFHAAGEIGVEPERLERRIRRAYRLIYLFTGERLIGVSAVKLPSPSYRMRVFGHAGAAERVAAFPLEFGWLYVLPSERGNGHADRLVAAGRQAAPGSGLFATVRADAAPVKRIFERHGYVKLGGDYGSALGEHRLSLMAAPPFKATGG